MRRFGERAIWLLWMLCLVTAPACARFGGGGGGVDDPDHPGGGNGGIGSDQPTPKNLVQFTPVGDPLDDELTGLEFLPGQNGEAIAIAKGGEVFYLRSNFSSLPESAEIDVEDGGERGLLGVVADPDYSDNHFLYLYFTPDNISPDRNRVMRYTVVADTVAGSFSLLEPRLVIEFSKSESPNPASNHNGGGLAFDSDGNLLIGVGDGGGGASFSTTFNIAQDLELRLGKIHRIIPDPATAEPTPTPDVEHFEIPLGQEFGGPDNVSEDQPSIYAMGIRNPTQVVAGDTGQFYFNDPNGLEFEEVNCARESGENFAWPECEGNCATVGFTDPFHGYEAESESDFIGEDPLLVAGVPEDSTPSVSVLNFYTGSAYGSALNHHLIYADFNHGWVRAMRLGTSDQILEDFHLGHQPGLSSLKVNPADGILYGVSRAGSTHLLKIEAIP